jgi:selenocysteine-specific elongation factor
VQTLERPVEEARGTARVALNVSGAGADALHRGTPLVTPGAWHLTDSVDVRLRPMPGTDQAPPERPLLHVGSASLDVHARPLGDDLVRLRLGRALPLRVGDRAVLRDPGDRRLWGGVVLDPAPPPLARRGAAGRRAAALAGDDGSPHAARELARRGVVEADLLARIGVPVTPDVLRAGRHLLDPAWADRRAADLAAVVAESAAAAPLDRGVTLAALAERLGLPSPEVAAALVRPPLRIVEGRVVPSAAPGLPAALEDALTALAADLADEPFAAPTAGRLAELGLGPRELAAAARAGRLLLLDGPVALLAGADRRAVETLRALPQPFTVSDARIALGSSRRVVLPLLDHLDRAGVTRRDPDDRRRVAD